MVERTTVVARASVSKFSQTEPRGLANQIGEVGIALRGYQWFGREKIDSPVYLNVKQYIE